MVARSVLRSWLVGGALVSLAACGGGYGDGVSQNIVSQGTVTVSTTAGQVRLSLQQSTSINEGGGALAVTLTPTISNPGVINGRLSASGGTATAGQDFTSPQFTAFDPSVAFRFSGDSVPRTVTINITDDAVDEPDETFNLTLTVTDANNNTATSVITITIVDNDNSPSGSSATPASTAPATTYGAKPVRSTSANAATAAGLSSAPSGATVFATSYVKANGVDTSADAMLGAAVAVASSNGKITTAVGAPAQDGNVGSVYVYTTPMAGRAAPAAVRITPPVAQAMRFGYAVQLSRDGNTLAVGAPDEGNNQRGIADYPDAPNSDAANSGAVFIYTRSNGVWSNTPVYVKAMDVDAQDAFGSAIALSAGGDVLVIGAPGQDSPTGQIDDFTNAAVDSGAVYVATNRQGAWSLLNGILKATLVGDGARFGASVAVAPRGAAIAVGAPYEDDDSPTGEVEANAGAAYLFATPHLKSGADLAIDQVLRFKAANGGAEDLFGKSVSLGVDGKVLTVGARLGTAVVLSVDGQTLLVGSPPDSGQ